MAEKKPMTTREAIIDVLKRNGGEMSTKEVVKKALPKAQNLKGKTAPHTVYTTMLSESKKEDGKVIQVRPGVYRYRKPDEATVVTSEPEVTPVEAEGNAVAAVVIEEPVAVEEAPVVEVTPDPKPTPRKRSTARAAVKRQVKAS